MSDGIEGALWNELLYDLRRYAYQHRPEGFILKSGRTSEHYIDCRKVLLSPSSLDSAALLMSRMVPRLIGRDVPNGIAGVVVGASALAVKVAEKLSVEALWVRLEAKGHGTKTLVEVSGPLESDRRYDAKCGKDTTVVIVEDVTTTGHSALDARRHLIDAGFRVDGVISLVDREEGAIDLFRGCNVPFMSVFKLSELVTGR